MITVVWHCRFSLRKSKDTVWPGQDCSFKHGKQLIRDIQENPSFNRITIAIVELWGICMLHAVEPHQTWNAVRLARFLLLRTAYAAFSGFLSDGHAKWSKALKCVPWYRLFLKSV